MTQSGVVTRLLDNGRAEVSVERGTACGGHCEGCETCIYDTTLRISAVNELHARPGDRVILESGTVSVMGAAMLVYLVPLLLFFAGYAVGAAFGLPQGSCILASLAGLVIGSLLAVLIGRRTREIVFRIVGFQR